MTLPELDQPALHLADLAFIETEGSDADRLRMAIRAYLWAIRSTRQQFGMTVYPSLNELREAIATEGDRTLLP